MICFGTFVRTFVPSLVLPARVLPVLILPALILTALFLPRPSEAKFHIEPYLGYSFTVINQEKFSLEAFRQKNTLEKLQGVSDQVGTSSYYHGITPGMRLGYSALNLAVGLDLSFAYWNSFYKKGIEEFAGEQYIIPVLPGLFVSYKLPLLFRAYASLAPIAWVSIQTKDINKKCNRTQAFKVGLSYLSLPFLSINIEYLPMYINGSDCNSWSHTATVYGNITF